jgi:hypothetical protein
MMDKPQKIYAEVHFDSPMKDEEKLKYIEEE